VSGRGNNNNHDDDRRRKEKRALKKQTEKKLHKNNHAWSLGVGGRKGRGERVEGCFLRRVGLRRKRYRRKELATAPRTQHTHMKTNSESIVSASCGMTKMYCNFLSFSPFSSSLWFWYCFLVLIYSSDNAMPRVFFHSSNFASDVYWLRQAFTGGGEGGREARVSKKGGDGERV